MLGLLLDAVVIAALRSGSEFFFLFTFSILRKDVRAISSPLPANIESIFFVCYHFDYNYDHLMGMGRRDGLVPLSITFECTSYEYKVISLCFGLGDKLTSPVLVASKIHSDVQMSARILLSSYLCLGSLTTTSRLGFKTEKKRKRIATCATHERSSVGTVGDATNFIARFFCGQCLSLHVYLYLFPRQACDRYCAKICHFSWLPA